VDDYQLDLGKFRVPFGPAHRPWTTSIFERWQSSAAVPGVVAGILPAVEPGILPGGKTVHRKTRFPSHGF